MKKNIKFHYAWIILILCCAIQAGAQGTIYDTKGVFTLPVCNELNFEVGDFSLALTFGALSILITQPFTSFLYKKFGMKKVLIVTGAIYFISQYMMSFGTQLWHWYVLMIIHEVAGCFFYKTSYTILICNWFVSKTAYALGIATAVGSIAGMLFNPLFSNMIVSYGWRFVYKISAIIATIITMPLLIMFMKETPESANMEPYTDASVEKKEEYFPSKFSDKRAGTITVLIIISSSVAYLCGGYYLHLFNYAESVNMNMKIGSLLTSAELAGMMVMKFLLGPITDKLGIMKTELLMAITSVFGYLSYFFFKNEVLLFTTALCGIYCGTNMVLLPLFAREKIGEKKFIAMLPIMTTIGAAVSSLSNTLYGYIYDIFNNYNLMFIVCIFGIISSYLLLVFINSRKIDY